MIVEIMTNNIERNLGEQPIRLIMAEYNLKPSDLVAASDEQITFKMISRACKGRKLTPNVQNKILNALNKALDKSYSIKDLFTY